MTKYLTVLGSTGSIGKSTLDVVRHMPKGQVEILALAAHSNIDLLEQQAREFSPHLIAVFDTCQAKKLAPRLPHIPIIAGLEGLCQAATFAESGLVVAAISGTLGITPTVAAIKAGKNIALANKEVLVSAGAYVMALAREKNVRILPVDSEHSALWQCLANEKEKVVKRLILTASGGPFRNYSHKELEHITPQKALAHPTWQMGAKVTIDSASLMNKGLEIIEAHHLFGMPLEKLDVVIHPQSLVHSMVEFIDGATIAQISEPDMRLPIQYAITYPARVQGRLAPLDWTSPRVMEFYPPDTARFPCLRLALEAIRKGGTMPAFMNAANEVLVSRFLAGEINWLDLPVLLERLMEKHEMLDEMNLEQVLYVDQEAKNKAKIIF